MSVELDTADAIASVQLVGLPSRAGTDVAIASVAPGSVAEQVGLVAGMQLLALSDPVRESELLRLDERASVRFVKDAFRLRRSRRVVMVVTPEPRLLDALVAPQPDKMSAATPAAPGGEDEGSSAWDGVTDSIRLVGLELPKAPGLTIGAALEQQYAAAQPVVSAARRRMAKRKERLSEVSGRNDSPFLAVVGAAFLLPALVILGVAYGTGYLDTLQQGMRY